MPFWPACGTLICAFASVFTVSVACSSSGFCALLGNDSFECKTSRRFQPKQENNHWRYCSLFKTSEVFCKKMEVAEILVKAREKEEKVERVSNDIASESWFVSHSVAWCISKHFLKSLFCKNTLSVGNIGFKKCTRPRLDTTS